MEKKDNVAMNTRDSVFRFYSFGIILEDKVRNSDYVKVLAKEELSIGDGVIREFKTEGKGKARRFPLVERCGVIYFDCRCGFAGLPVVSKERRCKNAGSAFGRCCSYGYFARRICSDTQQTFPVILYFRI